MTVSNPEATKARADLEAAISAAMPFASDRVRTALTGVVDELARIDKKNSLFERHAPERCSSDSPTDGVAPVLHCEREDGHNGAHGTYRYLTSWRDLEKETDRG